MSFEGKKVTIYIDRIQYVFASVEHARRGMESPTRMMQMAALVFDDATGKYLKHRGVGTDMANDLYQSLKSISP